MTDSRADRSRKAQLDLLTDLGPDGVLQEYAKLIGDRPTQPLLPHLIMPERHDVRTSDVFTRRLHGTLAAAAERGPVDFPGLLLTPGVGARTVQSLAMVAEVVHRAPYRFRDPARFSLAHGGKDRHPYAVPIKVYDETIRVMKRRFRKPSSAATKRCRHSNVLIIRRGCYSARPRVLRSMHSLPTNAVYRPLSVEGQSLGMRKKW
jgi:hypothetical protein